MQHHAVLHGVEVYFVLMAASLAADWVYVYQTLDDLVVFQGDIDDLGGVLGLYLAVEDTLRLYAQNRSHLTEALTAAFGEIGLILVVFTLLQVDDRL